MKYVSEKLEFHAWSDCYVCIHDQLEYLFFTKIQAKLELDEIKRILGQTTINPLDNLNTLI